MNTCTAFVLKASSVHSCEMFCDYALYMFMVLPFSPLPICFNALDLSCGSESCFLLLLSKVCDVFSIAMVVSKLLLQPLCNITC